MRGFAVAASIALLVVLSPRAASAQAPVDGGVMFSWVRTDGAEECPGRPELAAEVVRRLGYDPFQPPFGQALEGVVERADAGWTVRLFNRDADGALLGRRELAGEGEDCSTLGDAVALAMALAIDPEAALRAPEPQEQGPRTQPDQVPDQVPDEEPIAEPQAQAPPPAAEPAPVESAERLRLSLGAVGSYDLVPGLGIGVRLGVDGPILPELRWYGAVVHWAEQVATLGDASFGIGVTTFSLGLCAGAQLDWFRFDGCASVDLGGAFAAVYSPSPRAPGERFFASATALARVEARIFAPLWIGLFGGVTVPFLLHEYRVQGRDEIVFRPSPVAPVAGLDLAVRFR